MGVKRPIIILFFIVAIIISYIGPGVNVIYYCSNYCRTKGISAILDDACCEHKGIHQEEHHSHYADGLGYDSIEEHEQHGHFCSLMRVHFDWSIWDSFLNLHVPSFAVDLFDIFGPFSSVTNQDNLFLSIKNHHEGNLHQRTPRQYLRRLVLLII